MNKLNPFLYHIYTDTISILLSHFQIGKYLDHFYSIGLSCPSAYNTFFSRMQPL